MHRISSNIKVLLLIITRDQNDRTEYHLKEGLAEQVLIKLDFIFKRIGEPQFENLEEIAKYFRMMLDEERKKYILLFAYNGTGKTRLSAEFKTLGQTLNEETGEKNSRHIVL